MKSLIKRLLPTPLIDLVIRNRELRAMVLENRILSAQSLIRERRVNTEYPLRLSDTEFKVFSEWGEDGIIQFLLTKVPIEQKVFVEFGVGDYSEANTRFLLENDDWRGLVLDSNQENIRLIKKDNCYWRHDLKAINSFVTHANINSLIDSAGIRGDIGLLSIDIDGNDYWVWDAIDIVSPRIVICEYNSIFGCKEAITIPYDETFVRTKANVSNLYFGASLKALYVLGAKKGYVFVGSNRAGSNAFFVRRDVSERVVAVSCESGYVRSNFRESRDKKGRLTFLTGDDRLRHIAEAKVFDISDKIEKRISELHL